MPRRTRRTRRTATLLLSQSNDRLLISIKLMPLISMISSPRFFNPIKPPSFFKPQFWQAEESSNPAQHYRVADCAGRATSLSKRLIAITGLFL